MRIIASANYAANSGQAKMAGSVSVPLSGTDCGIRRSRAARKKSPPLACQVSAGNGLPPRDLT